MNNVNYAAMILTTVLNYLPFVPPLFYCFRPYYRFSRRGVDSLIGLSVLVRIWLSYLGTKGMPIYMVNIWTCVLLIILFTIVVKGNFWKLLMTLLITQNVAILSLVLGKYSEVLFFPNMAFHAYHWYSVPFLAFWELPILIVFQYLIVNYYGSALTSKDNRHIWKYLWTIPGTFFLFWHIYIYSIHGLKQPDLMTYTLITAVIILINGASFLMYYVILRLLHVEYGGQWHQQVRNELANIKNQDPQTSFASRKYGDRLLYENVIKRSKAFFVLMQPCQSNTEQDPAAFAAHIKDVLQTNDVAIRWHTDQFLLLLESATDGSIQSDADRLLQSLNTTGWCMGISQLRPSEVTSKNLLIRLNAALEEAARQGAGHYCIKL